MADPLEQGDEVMFSRRRLLLVLFGTVALVAIAWIVQQWATSSRTDLTVVISPYQDLAMLVNLKPLGLEKKYGTTVDIKTIPWEETYTAVTSAAKDVDLGFASYADYLTKAPGINAGSSDPLLFIFPAYIFKGGAFVTFKSDIQPLTAEQLASPDALKRFVGLRLGLPGNTLYQMILYHLANRAGLTPKAATFIDVGFDAGLLGAKRGELDAAAVGLTQLTEALKDGGRVIFDMNTMGFADITGFMCRQSVLRNKQRHIENVIRMWFDSVAYVMADLDQNSSMSRGYLDRNAATKYTIESYKIALSQEYFPTSIAEARNQIISDKGRFPANSIFSIMADFLTQQGVLKAPPSMPKFIDLAGS